MPLLDRIVLAQEFMRSVCRLEWQTIPLRRGCNKRNKNAFLVKSLCGTPPLDCIPSRRSKETKMNRYDPSIPRAKLGLTAVAIAAITIAALVALPAKLESPPTAPIALGTVSVSPAPF